MDKRQRKFLRSAGALAALLLGSVAEAQTPPAVGSPIVPPGVPPAQPYPKTRRQHWHDTFIGRPEEFIEPPLGAYVYEHMHLMRAKADPHRFTLYRSDFLDGSNALSPSGAMRFNLMATRLQAWPGPIVVEWSPDQPGLAESRRETVLAVLQRGGIPMIPERVVIGPLAYPGMLGTDAANSYNNMIYRDLAAPIAYPLTPVSATGFGATSGGGVR